MPTQLDILSLIHHVLGFQTMYCALIPFNMPIVFGSAMLWLEISTVFVAFRWMMFFHDVQGSDCRQSVNTFFLAISFIFGRTVFQLVAVHKAALPFMYATFFLEKGSSIWYLALIAEFFIAVAINVIMNCYWSYLCVYQIVRIFLRGTQNQSFSDGLKD